VIANEARAKRNDVLHAPTTNIMRTPLAGRTFEGFGEDPFLASRITVDWIVGAQGEGVVANVKHFAANNQEINRFTVNAVIDERTLREIYLPHFEAAVREAGVGSVMCSYNRLNGQKACENPHLLNDILKNDWGFRGYVLSDYGFAMTSTAGSANGGTSLELPQAGWYQPTSLTLAVTAGQVSMATIDELVRRILRTMFAFGIFDREPLTNDDGLIDQVGHAAVAQEVEEGAITLLKNGPGPGGSPVLPLDASSLSSIAVIGADADAFITGGGSGDVTPFSVVTPRQGITDRAGQAGIEVSYEPGQTPAAGAAAATGADVAIVFASDAQREFVDKPCLTLECGNPSRGDQDGLIAAVAAANPRTIVVLETGGPVLMPWVDQVPAVLEAWYPGQEGGTALARVLFGDVDPGGRLPATFPRNENDKPANTPQQYPGVAEEATYSEGVFVGYRHYDENAIEPLFPFGHGLSYTTFAYDRLRVRARRDGRVRVRVRVQNTGLRAGTEIVQLYLGLPEPNAGVPQPPKALKAMGKVRLEPRRRKRLRFDLDTRAFSYWDTASGGWVVAPGCYQVMVGRSSRDVRVTGAVGLAGGDCGA